MLVNKVVRCMEGFTVGNRNCYVCVCFFLNSVSVAQSYTLCKYSNVSWLYTRYSRKGFYFYRWNNVFNFINPKFWYLPKGEIILTRVKLHVFITCMHFVIWNTTQIETKRYYRIWWNRENFMGNIHRNTMNRTQNTWFKKYHFFNLNNTKTWCIRV